MGRRLPLEPIFTRGGQQGGDDAIQFVHGNCKKNRFILERQSLGRLWNEPVYSVRMYVDYVWLHKGIRAYYTGVVLGLRQ